MKTAPERLLIAVLVLFFPFAIRCQKLQLLDAEKSVVQVSWVKPDNSIAAEGTGFFVRDDGVVATAFHVYAAAIQAMSEGRGGAIVVRRVSRDTNSFIYQRVQLVNADPEHDLALLKTISKPDAGWEKVGGVHSLKLCAATELTPNSNVTATGYFGTDTFPVTLGAKLVGETTTTFPGIAVEEFLVSLGAVPGQSGSPVMLDDGTVIGVVLSMVPVTVPFNNQAVLSGLNRIAKVEFLQRLLSSTPA